MFECTSDNFYPLIRVLNYWCHHWYIYHLTVCFLLSCPFDVPFSYFFWINQAFLLFCPLLNLLVFLLLGVVITAALTMCIWLTTNMNRDFDHFPNNFKTSEHHDFLTSFLPFAYRFHFMHIFKASSVIDLRISYSLIFILSIIHSCLSSSFPLIFSDIHSLQHFFFFPTWDITDIYYRVSLRCTKR